jgi:uncharacterized protein (TIGR02453 family)
MDDFGNLTSDARGFLSRLAAHNDRDWFQAHKSDYEAQVKRPAELLLETLRDRFARDLGWETVPKIYRIYRDVRFSKDKTPYKTHLHLQWSQRDAPLACYFGVSREYCKVGVGTFAFDKAALPRWRARVADGNPVIEEAAALEAAGWQLSEPELKRVPAPYGADHPAGAYLRRKGLVLWHDLDDDEETRLAPVLLERVGETDGLRRALADALT